MATFIRRTPSAAPPAPAPPSGNVVLVVPDGAQSTVADLDPTFLENAGVRMLTGSLTGRHRVDQVGPDTNGRAQSPGQAGQTPPDGEEPGKQEDAAASTDKKNNSTPNLPATTIAVVLFGIGLVAGVKTYGTPDTGPTFKAAQGIGAFALFYIVAQAAERFVEMVMPYLEHIPKFGKEKLVANRDKKVTTAADPAARAKRAIWLAKNRMLPADEREPDPHEDAADTKDKKTKKDGPAKLAKTPEEEAANAEALVQQRRADRAAIVFGATAALGMWLCGWLEADFLTSVGVSLRVADGAKATDTLSQVLALGVTGLIVGGGSKGLHDLIGNVSKSSNAKDTPAETGGTK